MNEKSRLFVRLWLPVILWAGVIVVVSHIPSLKSPFKLDYLFRKTAHVVEYLVLAALLARAFRGSGFEKAWLVLAFLTSALFAASDEYHQNFVRGRYGTWRDFRLDTVGSAIGLALYTLRLKKKSDGTTARTALPEGSRGGLADPARLPPRA